MVFLQDSWYSQIYEKFRNERKTAQDPEVLEKKRKLDKSEQSSKRVAKSLRRGGINWEPPFPEGEDETSMKHHQDFIKNEWKKRTPDMAKIKQRMVVTFPHRRRLINAKEPLPNIKVEYPALFTYTEVSHG